MTKRPTLAAGRSSKDRTGKDLSHTIPAAADTSPKPRGCPMGCPPHYHLPPCPVDRDLELVDGRCWDCLALRSSEREELHDCSLICPLRMGVS